MPYQKSFCSSPSSYSFDFLRCLRVIPRSRLGFSCPLGTVLHSYDTSLLAEFEGKVGWQGFSVVGRGKGWEGDLTTKMNGWRLNMAGMMEKRMGVSLAGKGR